MPSAQKYELVKLREENAELRGKLDQLKSKHEAPLAMTTFSPVRDKHAADDNQVSLTDRKQTETLG